jgi:hypothetical protein
MEKKDLSADPDHSRDFFIKNRDNPDGSPYDFAVYEEKSRARSGEDPIGNQEPVNLPTVSIELCQKPSSIECKKIKVT